MRQTWHLQGRLIQYSPKAGKHAMMHGLLSLHEGIRERAERGLRWCIKQQWLTVGVFGLSVF